MRNQNELYHHGIKGMRWGVRRFQNKDGTLTNAGKKRYDKDGNPKKNLIQKHKDNLVQKYIEKDIHRVPQRLLLSKG